METIVTYGQLVAIAQLRVEATRKRLHRGLARHRVFDHLPFGKPRAYSDSWIAFCTAIRVNLIRGFVGPSPYEAYEAAVRR